MQDFIGLEQCIAECMKIAGVERERFPDRTKPRVSNGEHLIGILNQSIKACVFDVTSDEQYAQSYKDYACGMALDFVVLRVPDAKLNDVCNIFGKNRDVTLNLPPQITAIEVGGNEPIPEIKAAHERAMNAGNFSRAGRRIIEQQYKNEAGICGDLGSYVRLMQIYARAITAQGETFSPERIRSELGLTGADKNTIGIIKRDLRAYVDFIGRTPPN